MIENCIKKQKEDFNSGGFHCYVFKNEKWIHCKYPVWDENQAYHLLLKSFDGEKAPKGLSLLGVAILDNAVENISSEDLVQAYDNPDVNSEFSEPVPSFLLDCFIKVEDNLNEIKRGLEKLGFTGRIPIPESTTAVITFIENGLHFTSTLADIKHFDKYVVLVNGVFTPSIKASTAQPFSDEVYKITNSLAEMLIDKNIKYGNSALAPKRIFSKSDSIEQINVRIDDKLSRISNQNANEDEDAELDLMGYLVLKRIAKEKL